MFDTDLHMIHVSRHQIFNVGGATLYGWFFKVEPIDVYSLHIEIKFETL